MKEFLFSRTPLRALAAVIAALLAIGVAPDARGANFIIIDSETGYVLDANNPEERVQVASVTKIATAVVALDAVELKIVSLDDPVIVPGTAVRAGGINPAGLQAGDRLTLRDMLYCALLASDNIAAAAIANHVGARLPNRTNLDPGGNFVAHMNALARTLEMRRTLFLNPHGIDNMEGKPPHSTAEDIARLTRYAYSDPDFRFFVSQKTRDIHCERAGERFELRLTNTNQLLGQDGIDGVKTGRTARAGDCVVLSSWRQPEVRRSGNEYFQNQRRIIVVLLDSRDRFQEGLALIRRGWGLYDRWAADGRVAERSRLL